MQFFIGALISQAIIIALYTMNRYEVIDLAYLWYNLIAPGAGNWFLRY